MQMTDTFVDVRVGVEHFRELATHIALLPERIRPRYFTVGERVRNKDTSRIDDSARYEAFVDDHVRKLTGFYLQGEGIRFGLIVGETRNAQHESTHVGCSVLLRGSKWRVTDYVMLLKELCAVPGVERADACRRAEWRDRHLLVKSLPQFSMQVTLGVDMSAYLPGVYWWTVFSDKLTDRHRLDVAELATFAGHSERWATKDGAGLNAFRLFNLPDDWERNRDRICSFLESHPNFFSMSRIVGLIGGAESKEAFDHVTQPYMAGFAPWESQVRLREIEIERSAPTRQASIS